MSTTVTRPRPTRHSLFVSPEEVILTRFERKVSFPQTAAHIKTTSRTKLIPTILSLIMVSLVVQGTSNFLGQLCLEKVRREYLQTQKKAQDVKREIYSLKQDLDKLTQMEAIDRWALTHGMIPQEQQTISSRLELLAKRSNSTPSIIVIAK